MQPMIEPLPCGHLLHIGPSPACDATNRRAEIVNRIAIESSERMDGADFRVDSFAAKRTRRVATKRLTGRGRGI